MEIGIFSTGNLAGDPSVGATTTERLRGLVRLAQRAEQAGFDVFAVGEAHKPPATVSSPAVLLAHIAAVTSTVQLSTAVSLITVNDPVRLAEDYATVQHLADGRLSLMFGRGVDPGIYRWYGLDPAETVEIASERYDLFRRLWSEESVDWTGRYRPPLEGFTVVPRPLTDRLPLVWQTSIRTRALVEQTARYGDGFFANYVFFSAEQAAPHVRYFRERYAAYGHGTAESAPVGSGAKVHVRLRSQDALREFEAQGYDLSAWPYDTLDEAIRHSALTVGSPAQVLDKIAHFQERYGGYRRQLFSIDLPGGTVDQMLEQVDLLGEHVLPSLRATYAHA
ncbi:LLM class flavin-dependent oxidoreductase [Streptosporangium saharense]|uniref:LLM class flavin-dependent oxidoreductase n=1 Tax=Streptosporangium saharense TaxID=1706840 RepID=UPI0036AD4AB6